MINATTNVYAQRICLPVTLRVNDNPSLNEWTTTNYILEENKIPVRIIRTYRKTFRY